MAKRIITFLGASEPKQLYEYKYNDRLIKGRVFPEALKNSIDIDFDHMHICATEKAKKVNKDIFDQQSLEFVPCQAESQGNSRIKFIDIPDGRNTEELWSIFTKVSEVFQENDEVIFDITHAFRSLPFLTFLFAAYLKVAKKVRIISVLYGAIEQKVEISDTSGTREVSPVIQIGEFVSMLDWMSDTQRFVDLGDGNGLVRSLRTVTKEMTDLKLKAIVDDTANAIERVSDALIYIRPMEVMESVAHLQKLIPKLESQGKDLPQLQPFLLLCKPILDRYKNLALAEPFATGNLLKNLECQLEMMNWYQNHQQQIKSIMLGRELFVSILIYWQGESNIFDYDRFRKPAADILNSRDPNPDLERLKIKAAWKKATRLRNDFAHSGMSSSPTEINSLKQKVNDEIEEIKTCLSKFLEAATNKPSAGSATARPRSKPAPPKLRARNSASQ